MKYLSLLLFICCSGFLFAQEDQCEDDIESKCGRSHIQLNLNEIRGNADASDIDVTYHRCEWYIDPSIKYITGAITTYFKVKSDIVNSIEFDLSQSLTADSVFYHGVKTSFLHKNEVLAINLPNSLNPGKFDSVTVFYQGAPPSNGFGSFEQNSHAGAPIIWTLSEPYGSRDWWPNKMTLADKIDSLDVYLSYPLGNKGAGNGVLVSTTDDNFTETSHWKHRHAITPYLVALAVTNYNDYTDIVTMPNGDKLTVLNYVYPETYDNSVLQTAGIVQIIEFYNSKIFPYPFADEKYGHAQFGWGGGQEHQTMSFMVNFSHPLMAHECAHQWFGDYITCGSWTDIWLNEGFATYLEGLTEEAFFPTEWRKWRVNKSNSAISQPAGSVFVTDTTIVNRIFSGRLSYNKAAYLLHMLRWKLGDVNFFQALKNYLSDPKLAHGYARTADLQGHLEDVSGIDLKYFFDQWFYGQGYPIYDVQYVHDPQSNKKLIELSQTTSDPSVDFFRLPVPIQLFYNGKDTTVVLDNTFSGQVFDLSNLPVVDSFHVDPELWLLKKVGSSILKIDELELNIFDLKIGPNPGSNFIEINSQDLINFLEVIDINSKIIESVCPNSRNISLQTNILPSGTYILRFKMDNKTVNKKWIKI